MRTSATRVPRGGRLVGALLFMVAAAACSDRLVPGASCPRGLVAGSGDDVCLDPTDDRAPKVVAAVREVMAKDDLRATLFGVWIDERELATGAVGESQPGVPAARDQHFRIGNVTESFTTTLLLQLVDQHRTALADPVATWFPDLPNAEQVTLQNLASSTSGYVDYVTTAAFRAAFAANPFRQWQPEELIAFSASQTPLFPPGTSWAFSDSNFMILGEALKRIGEGALPDLLRAQILEPLGLDDTAMQFTDISPPVLHGYTTVRGTYEDTTSWNLSWASNTGSMTSNLADMHTWANAVASGALLSPQSHELQIGPENVGLGPLTPDAYYGMGVAVVSDWIFSNPHVPGYSGFVTSFPPQKIVVVVFSTPGPGNPDDMNYAQDVFLRIAEILTPDHVPDLKQRS